jgi:hypothetical protein
MNAVWRFYTDQDLGWRWQRVSTDHLVIAESRTHFAEYEKCVADAASNGYRFQPSQGNSVRGPSPRSRAARGDD